MKYKRPSYSEEELKKYQELVPTFGLSKSDALSYVAKMGASDSIRGIQQMGAKLFGADETIEELKKQDKKLQAILENPEYGNAALGTFLTSAIVADPVGWIPIFGTAKKAKTIFDFAKYGAMAGGVHSGMGYVSEEAPGLIGEKQSRLENTLLGVGFGGTLGAVAPTTVNAIQRARGKDPIYGLTKEINYTKKEDVDVIVKSPKKETVAQQQDEFYIANFGVPSVPRPLADPIDTTKLINFTDAKPIRDKNKINTFYKGFQITKDPKSNSFLMFIPGEKIAEKSFKTFKKARAHIDKFAIQDARRNLKTRQANLNNKELKLNDLQKEELQKSIDVGKSYRDRRAGQLESREINYAEELTNLEASMKKVRQQKRKASKDIRFADRRLKPIESSKTHRISEQKEYPFFLWYPGLSKSYRKGLRFKSYEDAKRHIFVQQRKGNIAGDSRIEIHTGSPSKINRGPDSKTLKQAGTFKSFADEYENSRLAVIESSDSYLNKSKVRRDALRQQQRDTDVKLETEAKGQGAGPTDEFYKGRFSNEPEYDEAIKTIVKETSKEGSDKVTKMNPVLDFYQEFAGKTIKNFVFNNAGSSLLGFASGVGTYNAQNEHTSTFSERFTTAMLATFAVGAGANKIGKLKLNKTDEMISERLSRMFIDDYGLDAPYKSLREDLQFNQNTFASKFLTLAEEANEKLNKNERKLFYNFMIGELDDVSNLSEEGLKLTGRARVLIKDMGQKYVDEGLLDPEVFKKNAGIYLHRSYIKSVKDPKYKKQLQLARQITLVGENLRSRGDTRVYTSAKKYRAAAKKLKNNGWEILEQKGSFKKPPKRKKGEKKQKEKTEPFFIKLRKDYTKEQRIEFGEIEDIAFAIAETGRLMSNDLATAKFFRKISENKNYFIADDDAYQALGSPENFVKVSGESVKGASAKKFGKLSGGYLKREVYDDITRMYRIKLDNESKMFDDLTEKFDGIQRYWKLSKTAWNPATHFNNTVSNFMLLDFADTKVEMLVKAAKEFKLGKNSELLQMATKRGIFDVDVTTRELKSIVQEYGAKASDGSYSLGGEVAKALEEITELDNVTEALTFSDRVWRGASKVKKATLGNLEKAYQFEDQVFRMAVFMDRLNKGMDEKIAAREAKKWFIDYDINAPMINRLRRTVTPFLSYTYRVVPLLAEAAILRPHKFAKWAAIGYGLNEVGKQIGGGNEELERVTMRDELSKRLYGLPFMPPRMIKLPFDSNDGDSQYIDISRLVPGGDIFDQREGEGFAIPGLPSPAQPGGLLVDIPLIMGTKKNPFTGQDIEGIGRSGVFGDALPIAKAIVQNLTPNVAILPGSYAYKKMQTATEQDIPFITGKREPSYYAPGSKYAAKYSPLEALAFTLGIKLRPQNVRVNERLKQVDYNQKLKELEKIRGQYLKDFRNNKNIFSMKEVREKQAEIDLEILQLAAEFEVYKREKSKARAKDVRLSKTKGGLVEGKDVPFTKENPAETINPYTGEPYQVSEETRRSSLLNTLRDRITRVQKSGGGETTIKDIDKRNVILNALKSQGSGDRFYYTDEEIQELKNYGSSVALVESDRKPSAVQIVAGKAVGAGRGKYQYEVSINELDSTLGGSGANKTALQRYKNFHKMYNIPLTARDQEIIDEIDNNLDFSTLSEQEQDAIFYADQAMGSLSLEDLVTGKISYNDAWYTTHYAGKDETKRNKLNERLYNE
tara:strand:+ start:3421 stop:8517 length:5097 start_codon:yes stop_codon:yes gene_type:complete